MRGVVVAATVLLSVCLFQSGAEAEDLWVTYTGQNGPGNGKQIVLISGDEEYRSEEALPQLGKILAEHHGFTCTVLFAIHPETGEIDPEYRQNIPGLEALASADLLIIATRFRDLPDEQMEHIDSYLKTGKPVIGMRTATHAFKMDTSPTYKRYTWNSSDPDFKQGFGRKILGETWINHHGHHGRESTRGIIASAATDHPIARGISTGSIWGPTDVYSVRLPMLDDCQTIVLGEVLDGMSQDDEPVVGEKNEPLMPIAWIRNYQIEDGKSGRVFSTTMGAATDLVAEGTRRMLVNATYWALGMESEIPDEGTDVQIVGEYKPSDFGFGKHTRGIRPSDHAIKVDEAP